MEQIISNTNISLQEGLNAVVMNKVQKMIENKSTGVEATMRRLYEEGKIAQDFIAPIGVNLKMNDHSPVNREWRAIINQQSIQLWNRH